MGTYSVYNSYTKPIDPQDSFVVLDSIQQSSNQNPSLTSSRKLEGLSHVIHQSQEEMVAKLEEQAKNKIVRTRA
ncbi:MAG: hypothetical protein HWD61_10815 [Parachlamydiaceae bacterium]|nr:MAG: hypothetical protein HWD61_10815 [Parachlamydiaceae bacterium]